MLSPQIPDLFRVTLAELGSIPRRGLIYFGAFAMVMAGLDLLAWSHRPTYMAVDYALGTAALLAWLVAAYSITMSMVERPASVRGFGKFFAASTGLVLLPIIGFALILFGAAANFGALTALGVALIVGGFVAGSLLVGWPILEATARRPIGPFQAIRMAKGIRRQLFFASLIVGGMTGGIPDTSSADDFGTAALIAVVGGLASTGGSMIALSFAVAAFKFMDQRKGAETD